MRINVGIPVENLSDEHLRAEEAEIAMLPGFYNRVWKSKSDIPNHFTLNKGHISFFMNKWSWSLKRYRELHDECVKRGFSVKDKSNRWDNWKVKDVKFKEEGFERDLLIERIKGKIQNSTGHFHYYREVISKDDAIKILKGSC